MPAKLKKIVILVLRELIDFSLFKVPYKGFKLNSRHLIFLKLIVFECSIIINKKPTNISTT